MTVALTCSCYDRRLSTDPCDCAVEHCRRCLYCVKHCPCPDPRPVGEDEADEPDVVTGGPTKESAS